MRGVGFIYGTLWSRNFDRFAGIGFCVRASSNRGALCALELNFNFTHIEFAATVLADSLLKHGRILISQIDFRKSLIFKVNRLCLRCGRESDQEATKNGFHGLTFF